MDMVPQHCLVSDLSEVLHIFDKVNNDVVFEKKISVTTVVNFQFNHCENTMYIDKYTDKFD